jgi:hypothetical protein
MAREDPYEIRCKAEQIVGEDRVPIDVLTELLNDYGDGPVRTVDPGFDTVLAEVARDLQLDAAELCEWFGRWLNSGWPHDNVAAEWRGACYAAYRLAKARSALRMTARSRIRWRERAIALGTAPHLSGGGSASPVMRGRAAVEVGSEQEELRAGVIDTMINVALYGQASALDAYELLDAAGVGLELAGAEQPSPHAGGTA